VYNVNNWFMPFSCFKQFAACCSRYSIALQGIVKVNGVSAADAGMLFTCAFACCDTVVLSIKGLFYF